MYGYVKPLTPDEIYHHGILGQKWGKRNGPPYPLGAGDHSAFERKAGWKKNLDGKNPKEYNKANRSKETSSNKRMNNKSNEHEGLTDKQKKAIKVGAVLVGAALVTGGAVYLAKSGKLDDLVLKGKNEYEKAIKTFSYKKIDGPHGIIQDCAKVNPLYKDKKAVGVRNNCVSCSVAYELRRRGYDVKSKPNAIFDPISAHIKSAGYGNESYIKAVFKKYNKNLKRTSVSDFQQLDTILSKNYPDGSRGIINFKRAKKSGHSICWEVKNKKLYFIDAQCNRVYHTTSKFFKKQKFSKNDIHFIRLDNLEISHNRIKEIVDFY
jgi:hypothetical protein